VVHASCSQNWTEYVKFLVALRVFVNREPRVVYSFKGGLVCKLCYAVEAWVRTLFRRDARPANPLVPWWMPYMAQTQQFCGEPQRSAAISDVLWSKATLPLVAVSVTLPL
jgi:hypothetical protein